MRPLKTKTTERKKKDWDTIITSTFELNLPFLSFVNADHLIWMDSSKSLLVYAQKRN